VTSVRIVVTGDKKAQRALRRVSRKLGDASPANKQVSVWLFRWVNNNFKSQGGKVGGWAPLHPSTIRRRTTGGGKGSAQILQDTGHLRGSFKPFFGKNFAGIGAGPHMKGADIPIYHEEGVPSRNLPKRRMLPRDTDRDVTQAVIRIYDSYIARAIRR
jgi:phage gpG-like protein